jgi:hypothetical protein
MRPIFGRISRIPVLAYSLYAVITLEPRENLWATEREIVPAKI